MIGNVEFEIKAHAFPERVARQDDLCRDAVVYMEKEVPSVAPVIVNPQKNPDMFVGSQIAHKEIISRLFPCRAIRHGFSFRNLVIVGKLFYLMPQYNFMRMKKLDKGIVRELILFGVIIMLILFFLLLMSYKPIP